MVLHIYGMEVSPPARAIYMLCEELNIPFEVTEINLFEGEHLKPEYEKLNPRCTVPMMRDGDLTVVESRAILCYIMNRYAKVNELYPEDPVNRAKVDDVLYFEASVLTPAFAETVVRNSIKAFDLPL